MSPDSDFESIRRARHRRLIIVGLATLLVAFLGVEILVQGSDVLPTAVSDTVLLHAITVLNITLLLVLLLVLGRNLIKLYVDRRHRKLGSKFKTKLMATYVGLSLVPTIILFLVASDFIQKSVDRWFSKDVTEVQVRARDLVRRTTEMAEGQLADVARRLADEVREGRLIRDESWEYLSKEAVDWVGQPHLGLDGIAIYRDQTPLIEPVLADAGFLRAVPAELAVPDTSLTMGMSGTPFRHRRPLPNDRQLLLSGVPVYEVDGEEVVAVLVTARVLDAVLTAEASAIQQLYADYAQGNEEKGPIRDAYLYTFLLISLLIIFGAVWLGLYLARGVTVPIQKLSEGTRAVAAGNLQYRVDVETNDELGVLVDSFNRMTEDLHAGQESLDASRRELERSINELEERRSYMESVLANIATGVVSASAQGRITTFNRAAAEMLGMDAAAAIGQPYDTVFSAPEFAGLRNLIERARPGHAPLEKELTVEARGERLNLAVHCTGLSDASGEDLGTVVVLDDLSGLIRAQKAAAWREVARRIAHEIRNPLTPIQLSAQRIARRYRRAAGAEDEYAVIEEGTRTILQEVASLKSLVEEFSRFARMPSAKPVPADLHEIVNDSLAPYPDMYAGVEIVRRFSADVPSMTVDPAQMRRAFTNLFDNAVKAMQGNGRLTVSTVYDADLEVVRVEVADNGPGIRAEDKDRLFVPYFSRKRDGTGLGLAIVRQIISDHHGYIRVVDAVPRGATFVVELPRG